MNLEVWPGVPVSSLSTLEELDEALDQLLVDTTKIRTDIAVFDRQEIYDSERDEAWRYRAATALAFKEAAMAKVERKLKLLREANERQAQRDHHTQIVATQTAAKLESQRQHAATQAELARLKAERNEQLVELASIRDRLLIEFIKTKTDKETFVSWCREFDAIEAV